MSWTYAYHQINQSFEQIAAWYREFMRRTEQSFRSMHQRITFLEEHQARGPSDEQVERLLRKILAEKFGESEVQRAEKPNSTKENAYFVQKPNDDFTFPNPIPIDAASLAVDPDAVPSKIYGQTFKMLESKLSSFPNLDGNVNDTGNPSAQAKTTMGPPSSHHHVRPW